MLKSFQVNFKNFFFSYAQSYVWNEQVKCLIINHDTIYEYLILRFALCVTRQTRRNGKMARNGSKEKCLVLMYFSCIFHALL